MCTNTELVINHCFIFLASPLVEGISLIKNNGNSTGACSHSCGATLVPSSGMCKRR